MMKKWIMSLSAIMLCTGILMAQSNPVGIWKTIDDETGEAKSHVEIYEQGGKYHGKIIKLLLKPADSVCEKCPGKRKNKKVVGMVIIEDLKPYDDYWKKGNILDPESGSEYGCSIWFEDGEPDELKVRGIHWTGLYRTQTWHRVK
ncbi:MAG: DUF2147 domain-containing protein [Chitinophagales bacterium]|nr:DUF2147 domain-containing protein [Chitinophagales bacterium]